VTPTQPPVHDAAGGACAERLLTAAEVADLLAVPVSWVREATRERRIPHLRLGRYRRYQRQAIEAWIAEQTAGPNTASKTDLRSRPG
jgi:excisionase family DNA binding protein